MSTYQVEVTMMDVHKWDKQEGEGDYVCSKGGYEIGTYSTLLKAKEGIKEHFGYEPDPDDIEGDHLHMSLVENEEAEADENGDFIVDYTVKINKIEPVSLIGPDLWYHKNDPRF